MKHHYALSSAILFLLFATFTPHRAPKLPVARPADIMDGIRVGKQRWATKNLSTTVFENGNPIPQAKTPEEWEKAGREEMPAWCYYSNDPAHNDSYGKLYNYYALTDPRGLAPEGWRIPTDADWKELIEFLGGDKEAGRRMKNKTEWQENKLADNICGFTAMPSGRREANGQFNQMGQLAYLWSETADGTQASALQLIYNSAGIQMVKVDKHCGLAVRCLLKLE